MHSITRVTLTRGIISIITWVMDKIGFLLRLNYWYHTIDYQLTKEHEQQVNGLTRQAAFTKTLNHWDNQWPYETSLKSKDCFACRRLLNITQVNNNSVVFCNENNSQPRKILLYTNGNMNEVAQSTDVRILVADPNLDRLVFVLRGDNTSYDFMDLYVYKMGKAGW